MEYILYETFEHQENVMVNIMIECELGNVYARIGGIPWAPADTIWPECRECRHPMQFLAQLPLNLKPLSFLQDKNQSLLLFQCQADPGMCDEWDPDSGGNAALLVPMEPSIFLTPPEGETLLPGESFIEFRDFDDSLGREAEDDFYIKALREPGSLVLGKVGGNPLWIQSDETPLCSCGESMLFVAQIEDRGGGGINFGDAGTGYAFVCRSCVGSAKFLWQSS